MNSLMSVLQDPWGIRDVVFNHSPQATGASCLDTPCVCPLHINQHPVNGHYFEIRVGGLAVFILVGYIKHNEHIHIKIICVDGSENLLCGLQTATFCNKISDLR